MYRIFKDEKQVIKMVSLSLRNHDKEKIEEDIEEMLDNNLVYMISDYKGIREKMEDVIYHDERPEIKDDKISWRREFDDTIFIMIIENGRTILLNNYYGRILELIDGKNTTGEIFKKIRKEFGIVHYQKKHFNDFIEVLLGEEIVQINVEDIDKKPKGLYKNRLGKRIEPSFLMNWHKSAINQRKVEIFLRFSYSPWFVVCEINYECNLRCIECYASDYEKTENMICKKQLSIEEFKKLVIDQLAMNKVFHIAFMGGEPFLRKDFLEILEYTVSKGFYIKIQSNGMLRGDSVLETVCIMKTDLPLSLIRTFPSDLAFSRTEENFCLASENV